jgi:hypothetical protein
MHIASLLPATVAIWDYGLHHPGIAYLLLQPDDPS